MVQTRRQVSVRGRDWIVTGRLKEVCIPAPVTKQVIETFPGAQKPAPATKVNDVQHISTSSPTAKANLNAPSQLHGLTQIFGTIDLIFRLYGPSECRTTLAVLREMIRDFITNYGVNDKWVPTKPDMKLDHTAVHKVLQEVHRVASSTGERGWNPDVEVFAHAAKWSLMLFAFGGEIEVDEYSEGSCEVHEAMCEFVRWALK